MNLRTKLLLGIGVALVAVFIVVAVISFLSMQESYRALEEREVITTVTRAESSLASDRRNLQSVTRDYAAWTDTYLFVQGQNPEWPEVNTADDFFERFNVYGFVALNRTGGVVLARYYDVETGTGGRLPDEITGEIQRISVSRDVHNASEGYYTVFDTPADPLILSSHPVLTNTFEGPATGSLHLVRKIDERYLSDVSMRTGETVTVVPARDVPGDYDFRKVLGDEPNGRRVLVVPDGPHLISGYLPLDDLEVPGSYFVRVDEPRTVYQSGQATMATFLLTLVGAGIFIIVFVHYTGIS
jgi:sensor domain CHASE-containing protein